MRHHARFTTEDGDRVFIHNDIEVVNDLTGEIITAEQASPDESILILPRLGLYERPKLALRDLNDYRSAQKRAG